MKRYSALLLALVTAAASLAQKSILDEKIEEGIRLYDQQR